jgi:hypothetical protein
MERLLRFEQAMIRRIETAVGTDTSGLLLELKSGMTVKRSGIGKIITIRATATLPPERQSVWKNHSFRSNTTSIVRRPNMDERPASA